MQLKDLHKTQPSLLSFHGEIEAGRRIEAVNKKHGIPASKRQRRRNDYNLVIETIKNIIMIAGKHTVHISRLANLAEQYRLT